MWSLEAQTQGPWLLSLFLKEATVKYQLCTRSTLCIHLQYLVMNADSKSLYGESDRLVRSLRNLWITGEWRRRLWPNPTRLEVNQYRAMDCKGWDKLVLENQCCWRVVLKTSRQQHYLISNQLMWSEDSLTWWRSTTGLRSASITWSNICLTCDN